MPSRLALCTLGAVALYGAALAAPARVTAATVPQSGQAPADVDCARGLVAYRRGELASAASLLRRCAETSTAAGHYLGLALVRLGRTGDGRRALAAAARLDGFAAYPGAARLLLDLGLAYLAEGNAAWAVRTLSQARELAPQDERVRYHLGMALLRLGEASAAVDEIAGARPHGLPASEARDRPLQLGLALYLAGRWEESRRRLSPLLFGHQGSVARGLLRAAYEGEGIGAAWVSAELSAGMAVDTNPLYEHETTAPTAVGPLIAGSLVLRPWMDVHNLVWAELAFARSFYYGTTTPPPDKDPRDACPSELRAGAFYARRFQLEGRPFQLSAGYSFGLTLLDGAPPLADAHHLFLEEHSGQIALQRRSATGQSQVRIGVTRASYADVARTNWGTEIAFEHAQALLGERLRLLGWITFRHEDAQSADYSTNTPGVGVGASALAFWGVVAGVRLGYEYTYHYDSLGGRWGLQRVDNNLAFAAELGRSLWLGLRLRAIYQRLQNFSTVTSYDYSRDLFTLALSWSTS
jgi:tetratricopeptide (TPR) repeat protein